MKQDQPDHNQELPKAPTGNASNPSPDPAASNQPNDSQLLDPKADKYIREVASIEDMPDPQEEQDAEDQMQQGQ
jgi:hypothetical protein